MAKYYIGFDCGTQSAKTALYRDDMVCMAKTQIATNLKCPKPEWLEMDVDDYLNGVIDGIKYCVETSGINPNDIRAICGDGVICGIVGVDKDLNPITPYINYLDSRTKEDAKWLNENVEDIWASESGNAYVDSFYPPLFARWFLKNVEGFKENGAKLLNNGPYVLAKLAGLKADDAFIDWATISGWALGYDVINKEWSERQMELLEIPMNMLPKIVKPWDIVGKLCNEMAEKLGIPSGIPIVAGAGDTMQSNIACGIMEPDMASDVAGTCAMFTVTTDGINEKLSTKDSGLIFCSGTLPDTYFYWGYIRTGGLSLRWFRDNVCDKVDDSKYYDELQERAQKVKPGCDGVLFLPYLQGGSVGIENASGAFLNLTTNTDQGIMWRAVLEAIGYDYIYVADMYRAAGCNLDKIIVTEGGSKRSLWNQIKADMLGSEVVTLQNVEGAVLSDAILAAYAVGDIDDLKKALLDVVKVKRVYTPNEENTKFYRRMFGIQQQIIRNDMKSVFTQLERMRNL